MYRTARLGCVFGLLLLATAISLGGQSEEETTRPPGDPVLMLERSVLGSGGSPGAAGAWVMNGTLGQMASSEEGPYGANPLRTGFWALLPGAALSLCDLSEVPAGNHLSQNFPNPFTLSTTMEYTLAKECATEISVFDVHGRRVRTLMAATQGPGRYIAVWDGSDESGRDVSPGIYFYRLDADNHRTVRKMVLAR